MFSRGQLLHRFPVVRTSDPEEMRHALFAVFGARSFDVSSHDKFDGVANFVQLDDLGIGLCGYGAPTTVSFPGAEFVRLQIGLKGRAETTLASKQYEISGPIGCVTSSGQPLSVSFGRNYAQLLVRIRKSALEQRLSSILGATPKGRLEFAPATDLRGGYGQSLYQMLLFLSEQLNSTAAKLPPTALRQLLDAITTSFLYANRHSFSAWLDSDNTADTSPHYLRLAEEYIEAHWNQGITIEKLTEVTGHGARAIFKAFKQCRGYSPMAFAKTIRLRRANEMLNAPDSKTSVTGVAFACGFSNLGHFAKDYQTLFKERPSETLRKR